MKNRAWRFIVVLIVLIAGSWAGIVQASAFDGTSGGSFFLGVNSKTVNYSWVNWYKAHDNNKDGRVDAVDLVGSTAMRQDCRMRDLDIGLYPGDGRVELLATDETNSMRNVWAWEATGPDTFYAHPTLGNIPVWNAPLGGIGWSLALLEPVNGKALMITGRADSYAITWQYIPGTPMGVFPSEHYTYITGVIPESMDNFVIGSNHYVAIGGNGKVFIKGVNITDGTYTAITDYICPGGNPSRMAIGDMDNDGLKDDLLIFANGNYNLYWYKIIDQNTIVFQTNWSTYTMQMDENFGDLWGTGLDIGDPVGDGKNRIIFTSNTSDSFYILGYDSEVDGGRPVIEFQGMLPSHQQQDWTFNGVAIDLANEPITEMTVSGAITYETSSSYPLSSVTIQLVQGSTIEDHGVTLAGSPMFYSFTTPLTGTCDLVIAPNPQTGWFGATASGITLSTSTTVNFTLTHAISGDANMDNAVDVGDLGILAANYGGSGKTWAQGDFNGDGAVDVGDLGILAANYGTGVNGSVDFSADYAKAFGTAVEDDDPHATQDGPQCFNLGLPLIAGLLLAGLLLVKLEE